MSRAMLVLDTEFQRRKAQDWVWAAKHGSRIEFKGPKRTLDQNSLFWVLATEVATQLRWHGQKLSADDWKLQFLDALRRAKNEELRIVPNIDNTGFVNLSTSSSDLSKDEMSDMIELVYKFGAEHGVIFNNETPVAPHAAGEEGSDGEPVPNPDPSVVAADDSKPAEAADQEAGEPEVAADQSTAPASVSLSDSDKAFLVRVFKTMKAAVGPDTNVFKRQAMVFTDEIGGMSDLVRAKAKTIREQLQTCCGDKPKSGTVAAARYVAGIVGVDERELVG